MEGGSAVELKSYPHLGFVLDGPIITWCIEWVHELMHELRLHEICLFDYTSVGVKSRISENEMPGTKRKPLLLHSSRKGGLAEVAGEAQRLHIVG